MSRSLIAPLEPEDCVIQTIPEVSPSKWHLAHVTWFFEHFCLREWADDYVVYDEDFEFLFNSYYLTVGQMHSRPRRGLLSRPTLHEVLAYRESVDAAMTELIVKHSGDADFDFLVTLGLNHEQLTYRYAGRDFRLTDVHGSVAMDIIA